MKSHLTEEQIARCHQRILDPAELLAMDEHVMGCVECRQRLRERVAWLQAARSLQANLLPAATAETGHPRAEQIAAYLAWRLDAVETELIASHLECCSQCGERLQALSCPAAVEAGSIVGWRRAPALTASEKPAVFHADGDLSAACCGRDGSARFAGGDR